MNKSLYNYTIEYYLTIKMKEPLMHTTTWNLKIITASKKSQTRNEYFKIFSYKSLGKTSYSDRKKISSFLESIQGRKDRVLRNFKEINMPIILIVMVVLGL